MVVSCSFSVETVWSVVGEEIVNREINAWVIGGATLAVVVIGAAGAFALFARRPVPTTPPVAVTPFTVAARKNLYFDALNEAVLMPQPSLAPLASGRAG